MNHEAVLFRASACIGSQSSAIYLDGYRFVVVEKYLTLEEASSLLVILGKNSYVASIKESRLSDTNFLDHAISKLGDFPWHQDTIIEKGNLYDI